MNDIIEAGQHAATLTRQLLVFSRKQLLEARPLDLGVVTGEGIKLLRRLVGDDVSVEVDIKPGLPMVLADPTQVTQVLVNLVVNARDAMPRGGKLRIRVAQAHLDGTCGCLLDRARAGEHVVLEVSDNGPGIAPEVKARLFGAVLHHQARRPGHGAWAGHGVRHCPAAPRAHPRED